MLYRPQKLCQAVCSALLYHHRGGAAGGTRRTTRYDIDLFKRIYYGFCEEACPVDAIVLTRFPELHFESCEGSIVDKQRLLEMGDRFETEIAADRVEDAPYRTSGSLAPGFYECGISAHARQARYGGWQDTP